MGVFEYTYVTHTSPYSPQSDEYSDSMSNSSAVTEEQLVTFVDNSVNTGTGATASNHVFSSSDGTVSTDIEAFFRRPVRVNTTSWLESDGVGLKTTLPIWQLWANNPYVKNKLNNYSWFRGDLKLKIQMTASPFYYGKMLLSYQPLPSFTPSTIVADSGTRYFIPVSQRPRLILIPGESDSYEMTIPFIYPANWLNIQSSVDVAAMGILYYYIYSELQSANGVTGTGITITAYAWVENIQLSGASVGYAMQSDEYGEGCVSKPASWVAKAATYFEDIPVLGPFATATRIGAGAVSAIASLFGFTNVPVIADTNPIRQESFPKLATSEIGYPVEKLTLDPKNELSVDPRIVGLPSGTDEMAISHLVGRESWLTKIEWSTADSVDAILFYSRVNPLLYDNDGATQSKLYMTPSAFVSNMFDAWRGDIIFRFHIIASKYHKGKLLINFDPTGYTASNIGNTTSVSNVVFTQIVDIGETHDVEFRVPYQMATQFLTIRPSLTAANKGWAVRTAVPSPYPPSLLYDNGFLTMRVLNVLTAPVAASSIDVHVYVRGAENLEFANPCEIDTNHNLSVYAPQSELGELPHADNMQLSKTKKQADNQYLVHFGENVKSLRTLLHRYTLHTVEPLYPSTSAGLLSTMYKNFLKMPFTYGYCNIGYSVANKIVGAGTANFNYCNMTPISYASLAFLCYRGSVNWTFDVSNPTPAKHLRVIKDNIHGYTAGLGTSSNQGTTQSKLCYTSLRNNGCAGQALVNQVTQSGINVSCPNMSIFKFQSTSTFNANQGQAYDGSLLDAFTLELDSTYPSTIDTSPYLVYSHVAAGVDFSLHYFVNVPTFYIYSSIPTPT
nr:MAG: capsid protein [Sanxia picorna-like virus 9]